MKAYLIVKGACIVASLLLVLCIVAPAAGAGDQPPGAGTSALKQMHVDEGNKDTVKEPSPIQRDTSAGMELGSGTERPMMTPHNEGSYEGQVFDLDTLKEMEIQDERSALSF